jgi:hypothetical protein
MTLPVQEMGVGEGRRGGEGGGEGGGKGKGWGVIMIRP